MGKAIGAAPAAAEDLLPDPWEPAAAKPPGFAEQHKEEGQPLRDPHPKDFDKLSQYNGSVETWSSWAKGFKQYLGLRDKRWPQLLAAVESLKGCPVASQDEERWHKELKLGGILKWKCVLNMYLEQHTKGTIRADVVETCGVSNALDAWRMLADRRCSQRPEHLHAKLARIIAPKKAVAAKDVERALGEWEREVEAYRLGKPGRRTSS